MRFFSNKQYLTGAAVPVSALHGRESCGIGEFADLPAFGRFCAECGMDLIQILPVNDTGFQSSPYSALSAFALHPVYMRLQDLPGASAVRSETEAIAKEYREKRRVDFYKTVKKKSVLLRTIYELHSKTSGADAELGAWIEENDWVKVYAVYSLLKERNNHTSWKEWHTMRNPSEEAILDFWKSNTKEALFYAWQQYHLERQLSAAAKELAEMGIALKGDLPILMNEDSADVWAYPGLFNADMKAGAPPDFYTDHGQNWGFPVYQWDEHKADGYTWWKKRLKQADKFYHAFRIDHVLGFFRIWATPAYEDSASMGHFSPYSFLSKKELVKAGFSEERIAWCSKPHIYTYEIKNKLGSAWEEVLPYLDRIGIEELFIMKPAIRGSASIETLPVSRAVKDAMLEWSRNRLFISVKNDSFFPSWHLRRSRAYESMNYEEKENLEKLVHSHSVKSEKTWAKQGETLLGVIREASPMLVCAEDLGVVPDCVPQVLEKLSILGLRICFWTREYKKPGEPFIPVIRYPYNTVCTLSVHDTGSFREWWLSAGDVEKTAFCGQGLNLETPADLTAYTPETAAAVLEAVLKTSSKVCVLQIQDILALRSDLCPDNPKDERINIPGLVNDVNWSYKIMPSVEDLRANTGLASSLQNLVLSNRPL